MNLKDVKIEKRSDLERNVTVTVSAEDIAKIIEENTQRAAKNAKLDGFRPGKAPITVIKQKYNNFLSYCITKYIFFFIRFTENRHAINSS